MTTTTHETLTTEDRAAMTEGYSIEPVYRMVARETARRHPGGGLLLDVGCGQGNLWEYVHDQFDAYAGADAVRYPRFPATAAFHLVDLDTGRAELPDGAADVVACVETIEHLENPRALMRELTRLTRPGGLVIVTTPNQLSFLCKLTLIVKNRYNAFQDGTGNAYPTHITPLIEIDLVRIARECGLVEPEIGYTNSGRIPGGAWTWPSLFKGRAFSDNLMVSARRPNS